MSIVVVVVSSSPSSPLLSKAKANVTHSQGAWNFGTGTPGRFFVLGNPTNSFFGGPIVPFLNAGGGPMVPFLTAGGGPIEAFLNAGGGPIVPFLTTGGGPIEAFLNAGGAIEPACRLLARCCIAVCGAAPSPRRAPSA